MTIPAPPIPESHVEALSEASFLIMYAMDRLSHVGDGDASAIGEDAESLFEKLDALQTKVHKLKARLIRRGASRDWSHNECKQCGAAHFGRENHPFVRRNARATAEGRAAT